MVRVKITRADVVLGVLLIITLTSAFAAWSTQARLDRVTTCTTRVVNDLVTATNERTTYVEAQADRTRELQNAQRTLLDVLLTSRNQEETSKALQDYAAALDAAQEVARKSERQRTLFPYPEKKAIDQCR